MLTLVKRRNASLPPRPRPTCRVYVESFLVLFLSIPPPRMIFFLMESHLYPRSLPISLCEPPPLPSDPSIKPQNQAGSPSLQERRSLRRPRSHTSLGPCDKRHRTSSARCACWRRPTRLKNSTSTGFRCTPSSDLRWTSGADGDR